MAEITLYVVILIISLLAFVSWSKTKQKKIGQRKSIPGPSLIEGIRIFVKGSRNNTIHLRMPELAKKYGDIMEINLLLRRIIFINDAEIFKRLVKSTDHRDFTNDRPPTFIGSQFYYGDKDILFAQLGSDLHHKRKIFHNVLKFYGEGRGIFEDHLLTFLRDTAETLRRSDTVELTKILRNLIAVLFSFVYTGEKVAVSSDEVKIIDDFNNAFTDLFLFENETVLQPFPFLRFLPGLRYKKLYRQMHAAREKLYNAFFDRTKRTFNPDIRRGLVDDLLAIQQNPSDNFQLDDETIKALMHDFTIGGYGTTIATICSLFLYLVKHQDVQTRIREEIKDTIGEATPSFQHRTKMPYTEAVLLENLRISSIAPFLAPHVIKKDLVFDGYVLPKSTILSMNGWHSHHREDFWDDPYDFKPDRFLDVNGQLLSPDHPLRQKLIPFGTGFRVCPGEIFAKSRTFLITVYLLKYFQFMPDEGEYPLPSADARDWKGLTFIYPDDFWCKVKQI